MHNYGNAIIPKEFRGDKSENELLLLIGNLESIKKEENNRKIDKRDWRIRIQ